MRKFSYQVLFNGKSFIASSVRDVCTQLNTHIGFTLATPDMISNIIHRPPKKRRVLSDISITQIPHCS